MNRRMFACAVVLSCGLLAGCANPPAKDPITKDMLTKDPLAALAATLTGVETYYTTTEDGWAIGLRHYRPTDPRPQSLPVVLCHGLSYNALFWDLAPEVSLARHLAAKGYDVWVPSLRGSGQSDKPGYVRLRQLFRLNLYGATGGPVLSAAKGLLKYNWTVDDHVSYDVPAILDFVTHRTGRPAVHWVGHSMGGMIMAAHLARQTDGVDPRVRSFVAVAVPMAILKPVNEPLAALARARGVVGVSNALVSTNLPALLGLVTGGKLPTPIDALFFNSRNIDPNVVRLLAAQGTEDIAPGQFEQLIDMVDNGHFRSLDHSEDYFDMLPRITTPGLWLVGAADNLATAGAVQASFDRYGASDKQFRLFGRANGQTADYGHDDLILSPRAPQEVWPTIDAWLAGHDPTSQPASSPASRSAGSTASRPTSATRPSSR